MIHEKGWRDLIRTVIERLGHELVSCKSGEEAITVIAADAPFDMVVTDYVMGQVSGLDVVDYVRADKRYVNVSVYVLSSSKNIQEIVELHGGKVLQKWDADEALTAAIEAAQK